MRIRSILLAAVMIATLVFLAGCDDCDDCIIHEVDKPPATPQGVYSVTGNHAVYLYWNGPYEEDIDKYIIWRSDDPIQNYVEIGSVDAVANPNLDLLIYEYVDYSAQNGETYYYAVMSVDRAGQWSELSAENVFDTPRPDGQVRLYTDNAEPIWSGFSFQAQDRVISTSLLADVYVTNTDDIFWLVSEREGTDLQDMGYTYSFDDVGYAPDSGWVAVREFEIQVGHTYVIWTAENTYGKMRVLNVAGSSVLFEWAHQEDVGNPELALPPGESQAAETKPNVDNNVQSGS